MGGEKQILTYALTGSAGSPPHGRGKAFPQGVHVVVVGITPAWAGKSDRFQVENIRFGDHPRVGGEKLKSGSTAAGCPGSPPRGREKHAGRFKKLVGWGSPPHGRGKVQACPEDSPASGITPAWAGKRQPRRPSSRDRRDHPRMGGEKPPTDSAPPPGAGSPPHGRGKAAGAPVGRLAVGITPAWAGKRSTPPHGGWCRHNHPRMGGEKMPFALVTAPESGSPPHGRGKVNTVTNSVPSVRITPAWAGKSVCQCFGAVVLQDHPRMGGEKPADSRPKTIRQGSPPHGRGKVCFICDIFNRFGITPAWAGKRLKRSHRSGIFISGPIPFHSVLHRPAGSGGSRAGRDGSPAGQPQNAGPA